MTTLSLKRALQWNTSVMDSERIYEVRAHDARGKVAGFGARATRAEGEALLRERIELYRGSRGWVRWWLEEVCTTGLWKPPPAPSPRERFTARSAEQQRPGEWVSTHVEVLDGDRLVAEYSRNYAMLRTFEPFRQGGDYFALISPTYTATSVLDLATGQVIAAEEPMSGGFCPVGFYVPDWWDLYDGATNLPGSLDWRPLDHEWPNGDFGFVWGCVWGDDSSWKVQYLDLSRIREGIISRDDRFGYLRLAVDPKLDIRDVIKCSSWEGQRRVEFYVESHFDIDSGQAIPDDEI